MLLTGRPTCPGHQCSSYAAPRPALLLLAGSSPHRGHNAFMLVIQSDPSIEISLMLMVS
jgi:hypothetical protein